MAISLVTGEYDIIADANDSGTLTFSNVGAVSGDLLVCVISNTANDWDPAAANVQSDAVNWSLVPSPSAADAMGTAIFYKVSDGTETDIDYECSASGKATILVAHFDGNAASPFDDSNYDASNRNSATTSCSTGSATASASGMALAFCGVRDSRFWEVASFTNATSVIHSGYSPTTANPGINLGYWTYSGTGSKSDTITTTDTGDENIGMIALFLEAAAGGKTASVDADVGAATASLTTKLTRDTSIDADAPAATASVTAKLTRTTSISADAPAATAALTARHKRTATISADVPAATASLAATKTSAKQASIDATTGAATSALTAKVVHTASIAAQAPPATATLVAKAIHTATIASQIGSVQASAQAVKGGQKLAHISATTGPATSSATAKVTHTAQVDATTGAATAALAAKSVHTAQVDAGTGAATASATAKATHTAQVSADSPAATASLAAIRTAGKLASVDAQAPAATASATGKVTHKAGINAVIVAVQASAAGTGATGVAPVTGGYIKRKGKIDETERFRKFEEDREKQARLDEELVRRLMGDIAPGKHLEVENLHTEKARKLRIRLETDIEPAEVLALRNRIEQEVELPVMIELPNEQPVVIPSKKNRKYKLSIEQIKKDDERIMKLLFG